MGLRDTIRAAGRGMTNSRALETSEADEDAEQTDASAEEEEENEDMASSDSKAAEDGDEDGDEDEDDGDGGDDGEDAKAARTSERGRIRSILKCAEAAVSPDLAMELAFETDMSASAAIKLLKVAGKGKSKVSSLGGRMKSEGNPQLGAGGDEDDGSSADDAQGRLLSLAKARKKQRAA